MTPNNLIFIQLDSLRYREAMETLKHLSRTKKEFKSLISKFQIFLNAYTPGANTIHSVPAILSSSFHSSYKTKGNFIQDDIVFISDVLKEKDFVTSGINTNPFLSSFFGYDKHFDRYIDGMSRELSLSRSSFLQRLKFFIDPSLPYSTASKMNKKAEKEIISIKENNFFLWIFYMDTHMPYNCGKGIFSNYRSKYLMGLSQRNIVSDRVKQDIKGLYDKSVLYTFKKIFDLLLKLSKNGLLNDTAIIITSDHGEEFWEHGLFGHHGRRHYQENIKVPLLIMIPDMIGKRHETMVSLLDLSPTMLDILSKKTSDHMIGQSFYPLLVGKKGYNRRYSISESEILGYHNSRFAVTSKRYKLIFDKEKRELYDLKLDPKEKINLDKDKTSVLKRLEDVGNDHISKQKSFEQKVEGGDIPPDISARLEALGYID